MKKGTVKKKFCKYGHNISKVRRDKWGRCLGCYADKRIGPKPPKQFCLRGHDTFLCGRDKSRRCNDCTKEDQRKKHPLKCGGQRKRICRRGHNTDIVGREKNNRCSECRREDIRKRRKNMKQIKIKNGTYKLPRYKNLIGKRFGNLTIVRFDRKRPYPNGTIGIFWFANCDCGNFTTVSSKSLQDGKESCGCVGKEKATKLASKLFKTYGNGAHKLRKYPRASSFWLSLIKLKYGLTPKDWTRMVLESNGRCPMCNEHFKNIRDCVIDHDHLTGKVRGLLCNSCNLLLGYAKDNLQILDRAKEYLVSHI